jgi:hypothetical protein
MFAWSIRFLLSPGISGYSMDMRNMSERMLAFQIEFAKQEMLVEVPKH